MLLIAGTGPDTANVEAAAARLGDRCRLLGRVDETAPVFAASDLFVLPSTQEGFGLVYLEAALQGVPSIGCRSGGAVDAIADGETGLLVPPDDIDALVATISSVRANPSLRFELGAAARKRVLLHHTDRVQADAYERIFLEG